MRKRNENEVLFLGHILVHPIRYKIVRALKEKQKLYIGELECILGIKRRLISFHLSTLSQYGFVEGNYEVLIKGKAAKYFKLTPKVDDVSEAVAEKLELIKNCV